MSHIGDMRALFEGIPLGEMNTSMTINATAMWLLALYQSVAEAGASPAQLQGTTQNDIIKGIPVPRHLRVPARSVVAADHGHDLLHRHDDSQVESDQHLLVPPAGGRGDSGAGDRLRHVDRDRGARCGAGFRSGARQRSSAKSLRASPSSSTPGCGSSRRCARCARFVQAVGRDHARSLRVEDPKAASVPLRRAGESLGLTEAQPENNVQRIVLEMLAVTLSKGRAGPGHPVAGVERGAGTTASRGISSGRCASSRYWPTNPTCSSTTTSSPAPQWWKRRWRSWCRRRGRRSTGCRPWAAPSRRSRQAT